MAYSCHDTTFSNHGDTAKAVLLGPHEGSHNHIPTGAQAAIYPQDYPVS